MRKTLLFLLLAAPVFAGTYTAASCSQAHVDAVLNGPTHVAIAGDVIQIPAGNCTWTAGITWTAPANVTIQGAGSQSTTGGGDATVITDSFASDSGLLTITTTTGTFRLTGITFTGGATGSNVKWDGMIRIGGTSSSIRVDHVTISSTTYSPANNGALLQIGGCAYGVVDHSKFDNLAGSVTNSIRVFNAGSCNGDTLGVGDQAFAAPTDLGSANFLFAEDNEFNGGASNDCSMGGRFVWRHNTLNMTAPAPAIQTHPTGAGSRHRGCRAWEIYGNTLNAVPGNYINAGFFVSAGTGVIWGNTIPSSTAGGGTGYRNLVTGHVMRYDTTTYTQSPPPNGWGYCGTHQTGTGSGWDQNADATTGYACLDQIGRGQGQLIINDFPNAINAVTGTVAWPNQALEPIYEWGNAYSPVPSNPSGIWSQYEAAAQPNRDYYLGTTDSGAPITFTGATGTGSGLRSARPATCTTGVGYWATDESKLYKCSATNTWALYYTPYAYPHPLVSGTVPPDPPLGNGAPPTKVSVRIVW